MPPKLLLLILVLATLGLIGFFILNLLKSRARYWNHYLFNSGRTREETPSGRLDMASGMAIRAAKREVSSNLPSFLRWWLRNNGLVLCGALVVFAITTGGALYARKMLRPQPSLSRQAAKVAVPEQLKEVRRRYIELSAAVEAKPDDPALLLQLARTQRDMGTIPQAMNSYRKVLALQPRSLEALFGVGQLAAFSGEVNLATAKAEELASFWPTRPDSSLLKAQIAFLAKNQEQARNHWHAALKLDPANREARSMLVGSYREQRNYAEAARLAETGMKLTPDDVNLRLLLARSLTGMGRVAEALTLLQGAPAKDRTSPELLMMMADLSIRRGEFVPAMSCYEEILHRVPDHAVALNNLAMLHADHGYDLERAATLASTLYTKFPKDAGACDTMGWVLFKQGKLDQALALLSKGAEGMPNNPAHRYHYGAALLKAGETAAGRREVATALKISRNFDGADQSQNLLGNASGQSVAKR
jgi:tetratricopeptide (TPR) repeat protein